LSEVKVLANVLIIGVLLANVLLAGSLLGGAIIGGALLGGTLLPLGGTPLGDTPLGVPLTVGRAEPVVILVETITIEVTGASGVETDTVDAER